MSLAIQRSTGQMIYFDAVTSYKTNLPSKVTNHPIDGGVGNTSSVTDNVVNENNSFNFSGVISDYDFNTDPLRNNNNGQINIINCNPVVDWVEVSNVESSLLDLLPGSVTQFVGKPTPRVTGPDKRNSYQESIRSLLEEIRLNKEPILLIEETFGRITKNIPNCIITNISFNETPESGEGLYVDINLEQVFFVKLVTTTITKADTGVKDKVAPKVDKGNQTSTTLPPDSPALKVLKPVINAVSDKMSGE